MKQTFTVAGVSTDDRGTKVRYGSDLVTRIKLLNKYGHKDVMMYDLPHAMNKADACDYLLNHVSEVMALPHCAEAVKSAWHKYHPTEFCANKLSLAAIKARVLQCV